jgi:hypothetical protein
MNVDLNFVGPGYVEALGLPVLRGRTFTPDDARRVPGAAMINVSLAASLWPGENPIGRRLWSWDPGGAHAALEVVGVVADGRYHRSWRTAGRPFLFLAYPQWSHTSMALHARLRPGQTLDEGDVRRMIAAVNPAVRAIEVQSLAAAMTGAIAVERATAQLVGGLAALALLTAAIGVYGVVSFIVAARTREIGVRLALGAARARVLRDVLLPVAAPVLVGIAIGSGGALAGSRLLRRLVFGVSPTDPWTFGVVVAVVLTAALAASLQPARRASRLDPLSVLRQD